MVPFFVNEHDPESIGISNAVTDRATALGVIEADPFVVGAVVGAVDAVVVVVVVDAGLPIVVDVVEADEVDGTDVDDEVVLVAVGSDELGATLTGVLDARAASAGTLLVNIGSSKMGAAAMTVTMRRLIEPRFARARPIDPHIEGTPHSFCQLSPPLGEPVTTDTESEEHAPRAHRRPALA
jgi:hypothetical protein